MAASAPPPLAVRFAAAATIVAILLAGVFGGLQRLGVAPAPQFTADAALAHGALMIAAWLGAVIALERAVALKTRLARSAPPFAVAGGLALAGGAARLGATALFAASVLFLLAHGTLLRRQRAPHTVALALAAACWCGGNAAFVLSAPTPGAGTVAAWFAFLVLTIAAERLEMTRLKRRPRLAQPLFFAAVALLAAGAPAQALAPVAGGALYGLALVALAAWLATQDIAWITIRQSGLPRYMACALLAGYAWLAVGGLAWLARALGHDAARDAAFHALGLGFVMSMVMAHAPVILPAVAGVRIAFGPWFYVPLALLHASLVLRLAGSPARGATLNAIALAVFAATVAASVLAARRPRAGSPSAKPSKALSP